MIIYTYNIKHYKIDKHASIMKIAAANSCAEQKIVKEKLDQVFEVKDFGHEADGFGTRKELTLDSKNETETRSMQITSKFTIAVHIITAIDYFKDSEKVTSSFLAGSTGANPVIVRNVMGSLKEAGIIDISQGKSGIELSKNLDDITLFDIYKAVCCINEKGLFHFHENPNIDCPVGRNIHKALDEQLFSVQDAMENQMRKITISDIVRKARQEILKETM